MLPEGSCYVVFRGRVPGIYATWEAASGQVDGFPRNMHHRYCTYEEAVAAWNDYFQINAFHVQARLTELSLVAEVARRGGDCWSEDTATRHMPEGSGDPSIRQLQDAIASLENRVNALERDRTERLAQTAEMLRQMAGVLSKGQTPK